MSNIVTFEQARRLKEIGYDRPILDYFREHDSGLVSEFSTSYAGAQNWNEQQRKVFSRPTVSEALDYLREQKGISCCVDITFDSDLQQWNYFGKRACHGNNWTYQTETFDTYLLASSALLTAVLDYLEKKGGEE